MEALNKLGWSMHTSKHNKELINKNKRDTDYTIEDTIPRNLWQTIGPKII